MPAGINNIPIEEIDPPLLYIRDGKVIEVGIGDIISLRRNELALSDLYQFHAQLDEGGKTLGAVTLTHLGCIFDNDSTVISKRRKK